MVTLILVYMLNSTLCYFTFGEHLADFVTINLKPVNGLAIFMTMLFCVNALASYPL